MASRRLYIHRNFTRNTTYSLILKYILQSISKTSTRICILKGVSVKAIIRFSFSFSTGRRDEWKSAASRVVILVRNMPSQTRMQLCQASSSPQKISVAQKLSGENLKTAASRVVVLPSQTYVQSYQVLSMYLKSCWSYGDYKGFFYQILSTELIKKNAAPRLMFLVRYLPS